MKKRKMPISINLQRDDGKRTNVSIARTVLLTFRPIENSKTSFATHIDYDPYNNKLSNLEWNECHKPRANCNGHYMVAIKLLASNKDILHFECASACKVYLESKGIPVSISKISILCTNRSHMHGYKFSFWDESRYNTKISEMDGEMWKLFGNSVAGTTYWVSNKARIKSMKLNGREKLMSMFISRGYLKLH
eukprot:122510_1